MNSTTRINCTEVLLNDAEKETLNLLCRLTGMGNSPFFRHLLHEAKQAHFKSPPPVKESRGCPGIGRMASRGARIRRQV